MDTWMRRWRAGDVQLALGGARSLMERTFHRADVPAVRHSAVEFGSRAGIRAGRLADWVLAVNEAAACAVTRESGTARLRLWTAGARAFCSVNGDSGLTPGPGAARQGDVDSLRRLLLQQICDYVSVESGPDGVSVLLSMNVT